MALFSQKKLTKKQKEIVRYIHEQRNAGHKDGRIRTLMEIHGHTPENLNLYFQLADERTQQQQVHGYFFVVLLIAIAFGSLFVIGKNTGMTGAVTSSVTGAISWGSGSWGSFFGGSYDCGDDYPADSDEVMDLSSCVADEEETDNYLFCYVNN